MMQNRMARLKARLGYCVSTCSKCGHEWESPSVVMDGNMYPPCPSCKASQWPEVVNDAECAVCGKPGSRFGNYDNNKKYLPKFLSHLDVCWDCADNHGPSRFEAWVQEHYPEETKQLPVCSSCGRPILEEEGWSRSKDGRFSFHDRCVDKYVMIWVPCSQCGGQAPRSQGICLKCRANATSLALFGKELGA